MAFVLGTFTGLGVGVVANLFYKAIFTPIGRCLIRHRIGFSASGPRYPSVTTDVCGIIRISNTWWGLLVREGDISLSARLKFKQSVTGKEIVTLARWKRDMDESTQTTVRLGSIREVILATIWQGTDVCPGSEFLPTQIVLKGDWDMDIEVIDADTRQMYYALSIRGIVKDGKLTI
jgi:hypothetical protein